jgi:menaquinone-dependent protoporphyrinogen oxidase
MEVLVGYATAHGSTEGIAERIAARLRGRGAEVTLAELPADEDVEPFGAVVIGSAVHSGDWLPEAETFVDGHSRALAERETWLFSVCSLGESSSFFPERVARFMAKQRKDGKQLARWRLLIGDGHHRYFAGAVERGHWSRLGDLFLRAFGGTFGDHRDWADIDAWADSIADDIGLATTG